MITTQYPNPTILWQEVVTNEKTTVDYMPYWVGKESFLMPKREFLALFFPHYHHLRTRWMMETKLNWINAGLLQIPKNTIEIMIQSGWIQRRYFYSIHEWYERLDTPELVQGNV